MTTLVTKTLPSRRLTLRDKLSRLTFLEAAKLLGPEGKRLIQTSGNLWSIKIDQHVHLGDDLFRLRIPGESVNGQPVIVTITLMAEARDRLHWNCTACDGVCQHVGAAFSLILEDKTPLGLAAVPPKRVAVASLSEEDLIAKALAERLERAKAEKMKLEAADPARPWTDYTVTNRLTGKSYRVALRGLEPGDSYCSCPDFRTNTLGTCKHVLHVIHKIKRKFNAAELRRPYRRKHIGLHLRYERDVTLRWLLPDKMDEAAAKIVAPLRERPIEDLHDLIDRLAKLEKLGHEVMVYPDADEFIQQRLVQDRLRERMAAIRRDPANHPLRTSLLKAPLLPYQLDGAAFAAGAGRAILADDMGLGKTIQGVGAAELLAREADIKKVLVVCPASLKSQWRS
ncbi:MAG: helicase, partial [Planctomycetia bacterium 21-64-5]